MQGKVSLEDHFAIEATVNNSHRYGPHVWEELRYRLFDFQEQRLRLMDEWGVEIMIASLNSPGVQAIPEVKHAVEVARQANDVLANEVAKRPDRFAGFAALPMQDPEMATRQVQRCIRDLGFKGALVHGYSHANNWMKAPAPKYAAKKKVADYFRVNFHLTMSGAARKRLHF